VELAARYGAHIEVAYFWILILIIGLVSFRHQARRKALQAVQRHQRIPHLNFPTQPGGSRAMLAIAESDPIAVSDFRRIIQGFLIDWRLVKKP